MTTKSWFIYQRVGIKIDGKEFQALITHIDRPNYAHKIQFEVTVYDESGKEIDWEFATTEDELIDLDEILLGNEGN